MNLCEEMSNLFSRACLLKSDAFHFKKPTNRVRVSAGSPQPGWPGRYINVRHCGVLSMVLLQLKDPLELFAKRKEFLPGYGVLSPSGS